MNKPPLTILQINTSDTGGGAERIALNLHNAYNAAGHSAWFAAGWKKSNMDRVFQINRIPSTKFGQSVEEIREYLKVNENKPGEKILRYLFHLFLLDWPSFLKWLGFERYHYPQSRKILNRIPALPDIVHAHNLHIGYFDLSFLPELTQKVPLVLTLHDQWLFTGHCAHAIDCQRWRSGCGQCPDLLRYPTVKRDATHFNWLRKRNNLAKSQLSVVTPSKWLFEKMADSILKPRLARVINNGVDQTIFRPGNPEETRHKLNIPTDAFVLLYIANHGLANPYKDYTTIQEAISHLAIQPPLGKPVVFISLGGEEKREQIGAIDIQHYGFQNEPARVAEFYQAADLYLHASLADTFPTTIIEALSCGCPVIATSVGGIPEQISVGRTGFLVQPHDSFQMANLIERLATDQELKQNMSKMAEVEARERFDERRMVNEYLNFYYEVIDHSKRHKIG